MAVLEGVRLVVWLKKLMRDLGEETTITLLFLCSTIITRVRLTFYTTRNTTKKPSILRLDTFLYKTIWFSKVNLGWYIYQVKINLEICL